MRPWRMLKCPASPSQRGFVGFLHCLAFLGSSPPGFSGELHSLCICLVVLHHPAFIRVRHHTTLVRGFTAWPRRSRSLPSFFGVIPQLVFFDSSIVFLGGLGALQHTVPEVLGVVRDMVRNWLWYCVLCITLH